MSNKLMILRSDRKNDRKRSCLERIRGYDTGYVEIGFLWLGNDKKNVIAHKVFCCYFLVNNNYYFLLANADLLKISVFIFFDKTYLQKPHCIMIQNIS